MPLHSIFLCSALGPSSGLIYLAAVGERRITQGFTFNPKTEVFTELPHLDVARYHPACAAVMVKGEEKFVLVGGGK